MVTIYGHMTECGYSARHLEGKNERILGDSGFSTSGATFIGSRRWWRSKWRLPPNPWKLFGPTSAAHLTLSYLAHARVLYLPVLVRARRPRSLGCLVCCNWRNANHEFNTINPLTLIVIVGVVLAIGVSLWMHAKYM